ncbi:MAG: hypothetical protein KJ072_07680 [Verrucomicrobia bacterium]|nr:hypothetical protein [Verrucomicrobiota bacterium]
MNADRQPNPLDELLADSRLEELRAAALEAGLATVRRRRRRRVALRSAGAAISLLAFAALISWMLFRRAPATEHDQVAQANPAPTATVAATESPIPVAEMSAVRHLTDNELLALFPGRPVALIGPPGRQRLVFLDELR